MARERAMARERRLLRIGGRYYTLLMTRADVDIFDNLCHREGDRAGLYWWRRKYGVRPTARDKPPTLKGSPRKGTRSPWARKSS